MRFLRLILVAGAVSLALAQNDLPRHGAIGLAVGAADKTKAPGPDNPLVVQRVLEGGAGAEAGFQAGDAIRAVDGLPVAAASQFVQAIASHLGGEKVRVAVDRGGKRLDLTAVLRPRPFETSPVADILYRSVAVRDARRRVIVIRPRAAGRLPAVLLMQGLGCDSEDGIDRRNGYGAVLSAFEEHGFVTMRIEKTGVGDSEGPPCTSPQATPQLEADGYLAALRALKSYDFVDSRKVFVFAHSMGPVVGSLAIAQEPVRGFIAVETVGTGWFEYDLERYRVQDGLISPPDEVDRDVRAYAVCSYRFYVEKQPPEELAKIPGCERMTAPFGPVPYAYMQAVADISLGANWKSADFPVLVVYGTSSPVTTAHQSRYLADLINRLHPGRATYVEIPGMSHDLAHYESPQAFVNRAPGSVHRFDTALIDAVMKWLTPLIG